MSDYSDTSLRFAWGVTLSVESCMYYARVEDATVAKYEQSPFP